MNSKTRVALLMALITGVVFGIVFAAKLDMIPHSKAADAQADKNVVKTLKPSAAMMDLQDSFAQISASLNPCVVNISTTTTVKMQHPFFDGFFDDDTMDRFFNRGPRQGGKNRERKMEQQSLGSGFVIRSDGYILTNNHVVENADEIYVILSGTKDEDKIKAELVGSDPDTDLAVLKIKTSKPLPAAPLGNSDAARVGDWAIAIGNPFGFENTVTVGIVSAKARDIDQGPYTDFIQTDAAINPGNSGGPLINIRGEVIGVNTAIFSRNGGYMGMGFAIPINLAKDIMDDLIETGHYSRGYLGITYQEVDEKLAKAYGLDKAEGALVTNVMDDTPAGEAGVEAGDVIIKVGDKEIKDGKALQREVARLGAGKKVTVVALRDGKQKKFTITLAERPAELSSAKLKDKDSGKDEEEPSALGIQAQTLDKEIKERLGSKTDAGIVVTEVDPESPAQEAGIQQGDIIIKANREKVSSISDFRKIMKKVKAGEDLLIVVERQGYNRFLVVETPKGK